MQSKNQVFLNYEDAKSYFFSLWPINNSVSSELWSEYFSDRIISEFTI